MDDEKISRKKKPTSDKQYPMLEYNLSISSHANKRINNDRINGNQYSRRWNERKSAHTLSKDISKQVGFVITFIGATKKEHQSPRGTNLSAVYMTHYLHADHRIPIVVF